MKEKIKAIIEYLNKEMKVSATEEEIKKIDDCYRRILEKHLIT